MFEIKIREIRFCVSFSFFAVLAILSLGESSLFENIVTALFCCFFHEIGHLVFMTLFSNKPEKIVLYGGGIRITPSCCKIAPKWVDIIILLAGCAFNFLAGIIIYCLCGLNFLCEINLMLCAFNLLPFRYFDGGRVLKLILNDGKAYDLIRAFFIFLISICIILMNLNGIISISFLLTFCFIVLSEILC